MVVGSVIARLGSKRLAYKNLLPFKGVPLVRLGVLKLLEAGSVDKVVISSESELIVRQVEDLDVTIIKRPPDLAGDKIPSIPVFQHIVEYVPCDVHVNYNINFPLCETAVIDRAVELALESEEQESLSVPYAVWAQTAEKLRNYGNPWQITALQFPDDRVREPDIHTEEDLQEAHRIDHPTTRDW